LKTIFLNPPFIGIVLGLCYSLIFTSNISGAVSNGEIYPPALNNLVVWLGQTVTPLASFAIGLFASREFKYFFKLKVLLRDILLLLILLKFILVPMLAIGFLYAFGINGTEGRIGVLIASLPVALAGFILCENYHVGNHIIAAQVVWGTVLMLPVIIIWDQIMQAMNMFG
jgi:predicted permease